MKTNRLSKCLFIVAIIVVSILIAGCGTPKVGDLVVARSDVELLDFNSPTMNKPVTCHAKKDQLLRVTNHEVYPYGSSESINVLWVEDPENSQCSGGAVIRFFKLAN